MISLGETVLLRTSDQQNKGNLKGGVTKYGRDHRPAQEASSNLILTLNDAR